MNLDVDNLFKPTANVLISEYWSDTKDKKSTILLNKDDKKFKVVCEKNNLYGADIDMNKTYFEFNTLQDAEIEAENYVLT